MIFGKHTLNETRDLLAVIDYRYKQTEKAFNEMVPKIIKMRNDGAKINDQAIGDLANDWATALVKWKDKSPKFANELTAIAITNALHPADIVNTEDVWIRLLPYVQGMDDWDPKTLSNIIRRIESISRGTPAETKVDLSNEPKQGSTDVDQSLFLKLDNATKAMEKGSEAAKKTLWDAVTSGPGLAVLAGAGAIIAYKALK